MTVSRFTVGTPRFRSRPPRAAPPCLEPTVYGSNVLPDPSVEQQLETVGGGPLGDELPQLSTSWLASEWSDGSLGPLMRGNAIYQSKLGATVTGRWQIDTTDPRTGTDHIAWKGVDVDDLDNRPNGLKMFPSLIAHCDYKGGGFYFWYSARIEPGDYWRVANWQKVTYSFSGHQPEVSWGVEINDVDGVFIADFYSEDAGSWGGYIPIGTAWTEVALDGFAPAGAYSMHYWMEFRDSGSNDLPTPDYDWRIDDFSLEIS